MTWLVVAELSQQDDGGYSFNNGFGDTVVYGGSVWVCGVFGLYASNGKCEKEKKKKYFWLYFSFLLLGLFYQSVARFDLESLLPLPVAYGEDEYFYVASGAVGKFARFGFL